MDLEESAYGEIVRKLVAWGHAQSDVRAIAVVGSWTRTDRPADEWSDLDVLLLTRDPRRLLTSTDWIEALGTIWLTFLEPTGLGEGKERRVLFEGGLDVDFVPIDVQSLRAESDASSRSVAEIVFRRGVRFLLDKDGWSARLSHAGEPPSARPPRPEEFLDLVHDFLYHAIWTARKLLRGELWTAKACLDCYMKWRLLRMVEWHARATRGPTLDVWFDGRFLEEWADPAALEGLRAAFAHYDVQDVRRALFATMDLFSRLAEETSDRLGLPDPRELDDRVARWVSDRLLPAT